MPDTDQTATVRNHTYAEIAVGDRATLTRTLGEDDIRLFALAGGDLNPGDAALPPAERFELLAQGLWAGGMLTSLLGTELPGAGAAYLGQALDFHAPLLPGDTLTITVTVTGKQDEGSRVMLDCHGTNQRGEAVLSGKVTLRAPEEVISHPRGDRPGVRLSTHDAFRRLMVEAAASGPLLTAIAHPCSAAAIAAAHEAAEAGLITPVLVGPQAKIRAAAEAAGADISRYRIEDAPHSHAAAEQAVALVRKGAARLLMKGSLHTDELMGAVLSSANGLRTERRVSHAYVMDVPGHPGPLIITDAAINIAPGLVEKADIIRNAIALAHVLGIEEPRVAILSAVETVNPAMRSTLDAAALCKMADRGQISGGLLDGPLAFDNAISEAAAREKGIVSPVAGRAQILVVPDIEAGNMLAKQLSFLGGADAAGIVLGARAPIILASRADSLRTRLASAAVAVLMARGAAPQAPQASQAGA